VCNSIRWRTLDSLRSRQESSRAALARMAWQSCGIAVMLMIAMVALPSLAVAQESHSHEGSHSHEEGLHFVHPLFAESVSPDTKVRLDYLFQDPGSESEAELEGEYAFHRSFSVEAGVHLEPSTAQLGETHLLFKFANYAFEDRGVLLGYGISFGLPTGSGHAHAAEGDRRHEEGEEHAHAEEDIYEIEPFLNAGVMMGNLELVGWTLFGIPTNQALQENVETRLSYSVSALYHVTPRIQTLLELDGAGGLSGAATERRVTNLAPGIKVRPLAGSNLSVGLGVSVPLSEDREFDTRLLLSTFYHF
jgi:hypothetical protein